MGVTGIVWNQRSTLGEGNSQGRRGAPKKNDRTLILARTVLKRTLGPEQRTQLRQSIEKERDQKKKSRRNSPLQQRRGAGKQKPPFCRDWVHEKKKELDQKELGEQS